MAHTPSLPPQGFTPYLNAVSTPELTDAGQSGSLKLPKLPSHRPPVKNIVRSEAGKAPWYDARGNPNDAYLIGVAGASASGKTYVSKAIIESLPNVPWVAILSLDAFYKTLTPDQSKLAFENNYNFDEPSAFDMDDLYTVLADLKQCRAVEIPQYSFVHHQRESTTTHMYGPSVILLEGIFALHDPKIRQLLDLKLYCQTDADVMLARRIRRDISERGRDLEGILTQYLKFVKPSFEQYVAPTAKYADLIVPGMNNQVAINVISEHIRAQLEARACKLRLELAQVTPQPPIERYDSSMPPTPLPTNGVAGQLGAPPPVPAAPLTPHGMELPPNLILLPQTPQLKGLLTILHDRLTPSAEFIFTCNRVAMLVVEQALAQLPHRDKIVTVPKTERTFVGKELDVKHLCSVSILRSGSVLEKALRRAVPALPLGSLLIQSAEDGEPFLYTVSLPSFIRKGKEAVDSYVFITDAQVGTGAAAFMAIRVILDHNVPEDHIIFLTLLASSRGGIWAINRAFPKVRTVVAGIDPGLRKLRIAMSDAPDVSSPTAHQERLAPDRQSDPISDQNVPSLSLPPPSKPAPTTAAAAAGASASGTPLGSTDTGLLNLPPDSKSSNRLNRDRNGGGDDPSSGGLNSKTVFAITPGMGSIGDRYFVTTSAHDVSYVSSRRPQ